LLDRVTAESFGIERSDRLTGRTADDNGVGGVQNDRGVVQSRPREGASKGEFWDAIIDGGENVGVGGGDGMRDPKARCFFYWGAMSSGTYGAVVSALVLSGCRIRWWYSECVVALRAPTTGE
jgi:hypothetical protein